MTKTTDQIDQLSGELRSEQERSLILEEQISDLEVMLEDRGWRRLGAQIADEFSPTGRREIANLCRMMAVSNPLIKRGLTIRIGYIWGQGVEVAARVESEDEQQAAAVIDQVNSLIDDFQKDNESSLTGSQASEELERALGTDGNVYLAMFTSLLTGRVQVRSTPGEEITDIICNPQDRDEPWFYIREYTETALTSAPGLPNSTYTNQSTKKMVHPALGYKPNSRIRALNGIEVRWDAPILHIPVNRLDGWKYGVPDAYASIAWARLYRDFLVDWAGLTKALSKIAWKATGNSRSKAQMAATAAQDFTVRSPARTDDAGQQVTMGPGLNFEAVSKSGATIDSDSGKPLAGMAAAGLGVSLIALLADSGVNGARATEETLDKPTILEMGMRRLLWQSAYTQIIDHVISSAVQAPKGRLTGRSTIDDWGRKHTSLDNGLEPSLDFTWPPLADLDPVQLVSAVVAADGTGKMPDLTTARLLLGALGVKDIDEALTAITDKDGNFFDKRAEQAAKAVQAVRTEREPADAEPAAD